MKSSWKIGDVAGIAVRIHATFPLLLLWVGVVRYLARREWIDAVTGVAFLSALFVFVTLHELGHALMAKRFGVRTRDITLFPIGGVARLEKMPTRPLHELLIAIAGPAVNAALALAFFSLLAFGGIPTQLETQLLEKNILARLAWVNVGLAVFNLLPAFPMDGGRVLRAGLAMRIGYLRATNIAAAVGQGFAVVLGLVGLMGNPFLAVIAVFVWLGAGAEARATRLRQTLAGVSVADVMMTEFHVLSPDDVLQQAVDFARASRQQHFPVVHEGAAVGMLFWSDLLAGLSASGPTARVGDKMQRQVRTARTTEAVERLLDGVPDGELRAMAVLQDAKLVGLFTTENLVESIMLRTASERAMKRADGVLA